MGGTDQKRKGEPENEKKSGRKDKRRKRLLGKTVGTLSERVERSLRDWSTSPVLERPEGRQVHVQPSSRPQGVGGAESRKFTVNCPQSLRPDPFSRYRRIVGLTKPRGGHSYL